MDGFRLDLNQNAGDNLAESPKRGRGNWGVLKGDFGVMVEPILLHTHCQQIQVFFTHNFHICVYY